MSDLIANKCLDLHIRLFGPSEEADRHGRVLPKDLSTSPFR